MAEGGLFSGVTTFFQYNPAQVQGYVNFFWYVILGVGGAILLAFIVWKIWQWSTYKYHVFIYRKIGDAIVKTTDAAKQTKLDGNYMFHYRDLNKYSPVIDPKYFHLYTAKQFFFFKKTMLCFEVFQYGEKIIPAHVTNPHIIPIDLDEFNYLQSRIKANMTKYQKSNLLLQMAPIIGVGLIVIMFIVGMIFYTKHIENIASMILGNAQQIAQKGLEATGAVQVVPPG